MDVPRLERALKPAGGGDCRVRSGQSLKNELRGKTLAAGPTLV